MTLAAAFREIRKLVYLYDVLPLSIFASPKTVIKIYLLNLFFRKIKKSDQGAYTCEAINVVGPILGTPDTIVVVNEPTTTTGNTLKRSPAIYGDKRVGYSK